MDKKEELISKIKVEAHKSFVLKSVFVRYEDFYYPIKSCFFAVRDGLPVQRCFDYGDLLFFEETVTVNNTIEFIEKLGGTFEHRLSTYPIKIPRGFFRELEENQNNIMRDFQGYSSLQDFERELLKQKRSYPKSHYRQWPTDVYIFTLVADNNYSQIRNRLTSEPFPFKQSLPVFPDYYTALEWWFGKELRYLNENQFAFFIPKYQARISNVKFAKDMFVVGVEEGSFPKNKITGKYFIGYENLPDDLGELDFLNESSIPFRDKVRKFYIVLSGKSDESIPLDYRNYSFGDTYSKDLDIEYEEGNIEYWLSEGESEIIEFKLKLNETNPKEFVESVCAFSNSRGGRIIFGVDDKANVIGLDEAQIGKYKMQIPDLVRNWMEPQPQFALENSEVQGKKLLVMSISKGDDPPYNFKGHGFYIRAGATDRVAARDELLQLRPKIASPNLF